MDANTSANMVALYSEDVEVMLYTAPARSNAPILGMYALSQESLAHPRQPLSIPSGSASTHPTVLPTHPGNAGVFGSASVYSVGPPTALSADSEPSRSMADTFHDIQKNLRDLQEGLFIHRAQIGRQPPQLLSSIPSHTAGDPMVTLAHPATANWFGPAPAPFALLQTNLDHLQETLHEFNRAQTRQLPPHTYHHGSNYSDHHPNVFPARSATPALFDPAPTPLTSVTLAQLQQLPPTSLSPMQASTALASTLAFTPPSTSVFVKSERPPATSPRPAPSQQLPHFSFSSSPARTASSSDSIYDRLSTTAVAGPALAPLNRPMPGSLYNSTSHPQLPSLSSIIPDMVGTSSHPDLRPTRLPPHDIFSSVSTPPPIRATFGFPSDAPPQPQHPRRFFMESAPAPHATYSYPFPGPFPMFAEPLGLAPGPSTVSSLGACPAHQSQPIHPAADHELRLMTAHCNAMYARLRVLELEVEQLNRRFGS